MRSPIYRVRRLYYPEFYQGPHRAKPYFEGWYYKFVFRERSLAVIPGISWAPKDPHCFVQWLDGPTGASHYHRFPVDSFAYDTRRFGVSVGQCQFSRQEAHIALPTLTAELRMGDGFGWPSRLFSPGSMGPYSLVPAMECNHAILVMDAPAAGSIDGIDVGEGRFYAEKDWGRSFPQGWVWAQSNSFDEAGTSISCSIARVPFARSAFAGFIIGFLHNDRLYRFASYTGARVQRLEIEERSVQITVADRRTTVHLRCGRERGASLAAPVDGAMDGRISETLRAHVHVRCEDRGLKVFDGEGRSAGLEVVNPDRIGLGSAGP